MRHSVTKLLRKLTTLTAHTTPESPRRRYQDLKRRWNSTPRNQRGLVREGMEATIRNVQQGIVVSQSETGNLQADSA